MISGHNTKRLNCLRNRLVYNLYSLYCQFINQRTIEKLTCLRVSLLKFKWLGRNPKLLAGEAFEVGEAMANFDLIDGMKKILSATLPLFKSQTKSNTGDLMNHKSKGALISFFR